MARAVRKKSLMIEVPDDGVEIPEAPRKKISKPSPVVSVMGFLLFLALGVAGYFYYQYNHLSQVSEAQEIKTLVEKIGKVVTLPRDETPTLATVTNKEKLDKQPFFQKAENGDKILIYSETSRAILYRPSTGKVIDMTTVNIVKDQLPETAQQEPIAPAPEIVVPPAETPAVETPSDEVISEEVDVTSIVAHVALYNGSTKAGVTNVMEIQINEQFPSLTIEKKEKATKNDYQGNIVIDLSGNNALLAQSIAGAVGGTVGRALPEGETNPNTDILIIIGNKG